MIVVAGVKRDALLGASRHYTADDVEGAVAIKRGDLDSDHIVDRRETSPELTAEGDPQPHSWLQIETDQRHLATDRGAMLNQFVHRCARIAARLRRPA